MRDLSVLAAALGLLALGCSKQEQEEAQTIRRQRGDAPPVEIVDRQPSVATSAQPEVEPNESAESATELPLPGAVQGVLATDKDFDVFVIAPTREGVLSAELSAVDGVDLVLELRAKDGSVLARSDAGPKRGQEGIPNFPVARGQRYFLAVSELPAKKSAKPKRSKDKPRDKAPADRPRRTEASPPYTLRASVDLPRDDHEKEPNSQTAAAKAVLLRDERFGYLGWTDDVDLWKIDLAGFSANFGLDLTIGPVVDVGIRLELLDAGGKPVMTADGGKGMPVIVRGLVPAQGEAFYMARLSARRSNPREAYSIATDSRALGDDDEREPNGDSKRATPLRADSARTDGVMRGYTGSGDVDTYRFDAGEQDVTLDITVAPPSGADVELAVRTGGDTKKANAGKAGKREEVLHVQVAAGKVAHVVVQSIKGTSSTEPYELTWAVTTGAAPVDPQQPDLDDFGDEFD